MPLSEEEQRILHEMEQKLYEHDPSFKGRVRPRREGTSLAGRSMRWSAVIFLIGFAVLLVSFRSSIVLGTFGFLVMLFAALMFERTARQAFGHQEPAQRRGRPIGLSEEFSMIGRRLRSRFGRDR